MRTQRKNALKGLAVAALALLASACQSSTPATRIKEYPALYQSLPQAQQELVSRGRIRNGMSPQAVFLAWGRPDSLPFIGEKGKKRVERWRYTQLEPVMVMPHWPGPCWGPCGWCDYYGPDTAFIPRTSATVTFENGKVVSWEATQPQP